MSPEPGRPRTTAITRATASTSAASTAHAEVPRAARVAVATAAALGVVHAAVSAFWMLGGTWLLETLGERVLTAFDGRLWLLAPVVVVKLVAALVPLVLVAGGTGATGRTVRWRRPVRALSWLGTGVLVAWGGANTVVSNLVLAGVVDTGGPIDRPAVVGHAWLWGPLFLAWGAALAVGLWLTRSARAEPRSRPAAPPPATG